MGFAEGFASGFNTVDQALLRRQQMQQYQEDRDYQRQSQEQALARQGELDQRAQTWHDDEMAYRSQGLADARQARSDSLDLQRESLGLQDATRKDNNRYRDHQTELEGRRLAISERAADASIDNQKNDNRLRERELGLKERAANADIDGANLQNQIRQSEHQYKQNQIAKQEAAQRFMANNVIQDPDTGLYTIQLTHGNELNELEDLNKGFGINVQSMTKDLQGFKNKLNAVKSALVDPTYFAANKSAVLSALNEIEAEDINTGLGPYQGADKNLQGGNVIKKELSNIYPSPDNQGLVFEIQSTIERDGKQFVTRAPMTRLRSSDPGDNDVRVVPIASIVKRIDGFDALGKILEANPQAAAAINNISTRGQFDSQGKVSGESNRYEMIKEKTIDKDMNEREEVTGAFDKRTGNRRMYNEQPKEVETNPDDLHQQRLLKAKYVLENRSQFKSNPDLVKEAERYLNESGE